MKILLTGAAGQVGQCLIRFLKKQNHKVVGVDIKQHSECIQIDLTDEVEVTRFLESYHPDAILHLAAITNIRYCEEHVDEARQINYGVTEMLVDACVEKDIRMVYFSTDYVFGKYDHLWKEDDATCPVTIYGRHKAECEALIQRKLTHYAIIRTAQLYGFEGDFIHLIRDSLERSHHFQAIENLVNCPTWIDDLLSMLGTIIDQHYVGIFHCVGREPVSRYEYALAIAKAFEIDLAFIQTVRLDFSVDVRPPIVHLDGANTYLKLNYLPKTLEENLLAYASCEQDLMENRK